MVILWVCIFLPNPDVNFPVKLADYSISSLTIKFYYTINGDTILKSQEDAGIVYAEYVIDHSAFSLNQSNTSDHSLVAKILATKLTALYGEPIATETFKKRDSGYVNVYDTYCMRTTWQGANNATILLDRDFNSFSSEKIESEADLSVVYQLCDIPALEMKISELEEIAALQLVEDEINDGTTDMTGL
jgi:hypothetical protein